MSDTLVKIHNYPPQVSGDVVPGEGWAAAVEADPRSAGLAAARILMSNGLSRTQALDYRLTFACQAPGGFRPVMEGFGQAFLEAQPGGQR